MERIAWNDDFSVGVSILDDQHKKLIAMINRLIDAEALQTNSEAVSEILGAMTKYAQEHFQTEEDLLLRHDYPLLNEHKEHHRAYQKKTVQFSTATMLNVESVPALLLTYLCDWWLQHIQQEDKKYSRFLASKGVK